MPLWNRGPGSNDLITNDFKTLHLSKKTSLVGFKYPGQKRNIYEFSSFPKVLCCIYMWWLTSTGIILVYIQCSMVIWRICFKICFGMNFNQISLNFRQLHSLCIHLYNATCQHREIFQTESEDNVLHNKLRWKKTFIFQRI